MAFLHVKLPESCTAPLRLDKYIASLQDGMNRSKLKAGVHEILINGKHGKLSSKVAAGDEIDIEWEDNIPDNIAPENIALRIVYEDDDVLVIDKTQGMVTHPACGNWSGTLVNALLYHLHADAIPLEKHATQSEMLASRRPGIVHRLDKDTSGVIIAAKCRDAETWLCAQFKERCVQKEYIAIVQGKPPALAGDIRTQIIRDPKNRKRFKAATQTDDGKCARTLYHCIASYGNYSLMRLRLKTGRTHQIRVHMKYIGCPVLGDVIYGMRDKLFPDATLMLHAQKLVLRLPNQTAFTTFRSRTPARFKAIIKELRKRYERIVMTWGKNHAKKKR